MATAIDRLGRRVGRLARMAVDLQSLAVDLSTELAVMRRVLEDHASGRVDVVAELALRRAADARRRADKRAAATGASKLEMRLSRAGRAMVRIDGSEWIRLTRGDGRLLHILAETPAGADGFPHWRTYDEIQSTIARKTGSRPTRRAVIESVYRVRRAMKGSDVNEYLLQVDRGSGRLRVLVRAVRQDRAFSWTKMASPLKSPASTSSPHFELPSTALRDR
jgi:hypothetical protein